MNWHTPAFLTHEDDPRDRAPSDPTHRPALAAPGTLARLTDQQHRVLDALPANGARVAVYDLAQRLGLSVSEVASDLLELKRLDLAEGLPSGWRRKEVAGG